MLKFLYFLEVLTVEILPLKLYFLFFKNHVTAKDGIEINIKPANNDLINLFIFIPFYLMGLIMFTL